MEEKKYILTEKQLISLIQDRLELQCLEANGVDNWCWYGDNRLEFIADCLNITEDEVDYFGYTINDVALKILYKEYKEV